MSKAVGILELSSIAKGMETGDAMLKSANVELLVSKTLCPGKFLLMLGGDVGAVQLAQYLSSLYLTALTRWLSLPDLDLRGELLMVVDFFMRAAQVEDKQPEQQA